MKVVLLSALFLFDVAFATENPLGRVFGLMDDLKAKIIREGEAEQATYEEFAEWCEDASKDTGFEIKTQTSSKDKLEAKIEKNTAVITETDTEIEGKANDISTAESDLKGATEIRTKEAAEFRAAEKELLDTVDTLTVAINTMQRAQQSHSVTAAMMQISSPGLQGVLKSLNTVIDAASFTAQDKDKLMALVQSQQAASNEGADDDMDAPQAEAYKSHSGGIVELLEDMKEKAEEQLTSIRKAEQSAVQNYAMMKQSLEDEIDSANHDLTDLKTRKAEASQGKATAEGNLDATVKALSTLQSKLDELHATCMQTAADHESNVRSRSEELNVIAEAKKILQESTSGAAQQTYSLLQINGEQVQSVRVRTGTDLANAEIVDILKKLASQHHSTALSQLVSRVSAVLKYGAGAGQNPFGKVKGLINDLLAKLEKEAKEDATEKAYCDKQMGDTEAKKTELDNTVGKLSTKLDEATVASTGAKEEVKELQASLAKISKENAQMAKIRAEESAEYNTAKTELENGLEGVRKALSVLREYYGSAAASAAMLQNTDGSMREAMEQPAMPEKHEKSGGAGGSIISILEVCESDFAKNLATEETAEEDAASEYEKTMNQNAMTKTLQEQDVKYKTAEFKAIDKTISEISGDRETAYSELQAVMEFFGKIKERCVAKPESYEARKGRREAEIGGLKEALNILDSETALVQHRKRNRKHGFLGHH